MPIHPSAPLQQPGYLLGIDTGGTFTDAVLLDARRQVVAAAKSLTTRFDLSVGIGGSIDRLPPELLRQVRLVSLSTTLTTNSVVEGKGSPVCVLLAGYDAPQLKASGLVDLLGSDAVVSLRRWTRRARAWRFNTMRRGCRPSPSRPPLVCAIRRTSCVCVSWWSRCATGR
jgi:hypothetical protein